MSEADASFQDAFLRYGLYTLLGYLLVFHLLPAFRRRVSTWLLVLSTRSYRNGAREDFARLFAPLAAEKEKLDRDLRIVEVGVGAGLNFEHYPRGSRITCVEPNAEMMRPYVEEAASEAGVHVEALHAGFAEDMSMLKNDFFDVAVVTLVLCSVNDPEASVREIKRVLRPGGTFYYWEHTVATKSTPLWFLQVLCHPLLLFLFNCNMRRETWKYIEEAKFSSHEYNRFYRNIKFVIIKPTLVGTAVK